MQTTDAGKFRAVLTGMLRMYDKQPDDLLLDAYWIALRDWEYREFEAAAKHLMTTATFMPRPADFTALRKAGEPTAGEAWAKALAWIRSGNTHSMGDDRIDRAAYAMGGWRVLGMTKSDAIQFAEKRFCEHYEAMNQAAQIREALPSVAREQRTSIGGPKPFALHLEPPRKTE
jgi:hypothetical protein